MKVIFLNVILMIVTVYQERGKGGTEDGKDKKPPPCLVTALVAPRLPHQIRNIQERDHHDGIYLQTLREETQDTTQAMGGEVFMQRGLPHREGDFLRYPRGDLDWMQLVGVEGKENILETNSILWIEDVANNLEDLSTLALVATVDIVTQRC